MHHLVIGGAGFIGVNLAERLARDGESVVVVDNFSRVGALDNAAWLRENYPDIPLVSADVRTDTGLLERLAGEAEAVYHLAAQVAVTTSVADPRLDFEVNALGTLNVLEAIRRSGGDPVLVYASTNKVYGALEHVAIVEEERRCGYADSRPGISETEPLDLHSPYGCSKGAGDQYVRDYARIYGLRTAVLRQSCIYGPRQFSIEDQGWLAWFCIAAALGKPITIYGDGRQVRDLLHVADLIELMRTLAHAGPPAVGSIYNVGGGPEHTLSLLEALESIERELGTSVEYMHASPRPGDQRVYISDISKVREETGWRPQILIEDGLAELVEWVNANRPLFERVGAPAAS